MASTRAKILLRELIALPSVNPAFLPVGAAHTGEHRVAEFLASTAARAGLDVQFKEVFSNRSNVLAHFTPGRNVRQHILLAPHMDTVGEPGFSSRLFEPREKNGRLHGRGAC